jgi:hypothetical protein
MLAINSTLRVRVLASGPGPGPPLAAVGLAVGDSLDVKHGVTKHPKTNPIGDCRLKRRNAGKQKVRNFAVKTTSSLPPTPHMHGSRVKAPVTSSCPVGFVSYYGHSSMAISDSGSIPVISGSYKAQQLVYVWYGMAIALFCQSRSCRELK